MSASTPRHDGGPIVRGAVGEAMRRRSVDSIPAVIVQHPFLASPLEPLPPRPYPTQLTDISEEGSSPRSGASASPPNPALGQLTSLRNAVQAFALRLQAIPPPDSSPDVSRTSDSPGSGFERVRRVKSMSSVAGQDEVERRRTGSDGTFGAGATLSGPSGDVTTTPGASETIERTIPSEARLAGPALTPANGHSPISPLALTGAPLPQIPRSTTPVPPERPTSGGPPPSLHVTRPSTSDAGSELQPFAAVVDMMERGRGRSPGPRLGTDEVTLHRAGTARSAGEGRAQTPRRGMMGPKGLIAKVKSSSSLSKVRQAAKGRSLHEENPVASSTGGGRPVSRSSAPSKQSSTGTDYLRPAPPPPPSSSYPARFAQTEYPRSNASSPTPSPRPGSSFARASPGMAAPPRRLTQHGLESQAGEMVEIPRFGRKELNMSLVKRRGPGQRLAWVLLWAVWLVNGLAGLFFDVNLMYMLVQCTVHTNRGDGGPSRSWAFATAAYAICWGISTFAVWLGWEVYYEFWRKWRQVRPAIEPIYTSFPAALHLSLLSYRHFTFLAHIRLSSLSTPYRRDVLPETVCSLVQLFPGLLPLLPRAGIAIVLLTTFSGASSTRNDRDDRFFTSSGNLTAYARGVTFAFVAVIGFRLLLDLVSAIALSVCSSRPFQSWLGPRSKSTPSTPTTPQRKKKSSLEPRDPATTRSPQKTWYEAETSFGWDGWRARMRSRVQDTYELCMIRKGGTGLGMMVNGSYLIVGHATPSPRVGDGIPLRAATPGKHDHKGSIEELADQGENPMTEEAVDELLGTPTIGSTLLKLSQSRPANPAPSSSQSHSSPSSHGHHATTEQPQLIEPTRTTSNVSSTGLYAPSSHASQSTQDVFYTPAQGSTPVPASSPMVDRSLANESRATLVPGAGPLRGLADPSRATLPARPESDVMVNQELLSDPRRLSQESGTEESVTDDSVALLPSRRESAATADGSPALSLANSESTSSASHGDPASPSRNQAVSAILSRSGSGSLGTVGHTLNRARSSSITLLKEGGEAVQGVVRRARSGTVGGQGYDRMEGDFSPGTMTRRRSKLGLGFSTVQPEQEPVVTTM